MENKERNSFIKWLDNTWYHYKIAIVIGAFALVVVVVGLVQMLSKQEPDVFIYSVGQYGLTAEAGDKFITGLEEDFGYDANGDGKCVFDIKIDKFDMITDEEGTRYVDDPTGQNLPVQRFNLEIMAGECIIYIMEPAFFHANTKYLASLEKELGYLPENAVKGKGIVISDLDYYWAEKYGEDVLPQMKQTSVLGYFPEDYIICLADREDRYKEDYYKGNVEFFKSLVEFKH